MSRAGGDPLAADALPALAAQAAMVSEALPDPEPGPIRSALADDGAARIDRAVALMDAAIGGYNDRLEAVVEARMRGPKARKGTRFWSDGVKSVSGRGEVASYGHRTEVKALDASYVLPERVVTEVADAVRPVGLRIVADASAAVAKSLGRPNTGLAALDWSAISSAVDSVVGRMLEVNERHAVDIRREILAADSTAGNLTEAIDRVMEATKRGGRWLLINGRTLATALAGDAALGAAKALGVTHTQWLSRRDDRVRHTHVEADGQIRPVGERFSVGDFRLRYPADPMVLPEGAREVMNCFIAGTEVSAPDVEASFRAPYVGEIVTIHSAAGRVLTGTPNHPVLTERGWVALGELDEGDHVIGARHVHNVDPVVDPHVQRSPSSIDEVHRALATLAPHQRVSGSAVNFHGDRPAGEVDVVAVHRPLRVGEHAALGEQVSDEHLPGGGETSQASADPSRPDNFSLIAHPPASGDVRCNDQGDPSGVIQLGPAQYQGLRAPAWLHAATLKTSPNGGPSDPESFAESLLALAVPVAPNDLGGIQSYAQSGALSAARLPAGDSGSLESTVNERGAHPKGGSDFGERLAGAVELDRVVEVEREPFSGHVYTLQTTSGMFLANSIPTKNCRCSLLFSRPAPDKARAVGLAQRGTPKAATRLLRAGIPRTDGPLVVSAPELGEPMAIPEVPVPADVVGYRVLGDEVAVTPGQQLSWPGALALALAPPVVAGAAVLAVTVPAGTLVGVSGGALVLAAGVVLAVAAVSAGQIVATPVAAA